MKANANVGAQAVPNTGASEDGHDTRAPWQCKVSHDLYTTRTTGSRWYHVNSQTLVEVCCVCFWSCN